MIRRWDYFRGDKVNLKIIENERPLWTLKYLEEVCKHTKSFGNDILLAENEIKNNINKGSPDIRIDISDSICFEIYEDDNFIGDIVLVKDRNSSGEFFYDISILIFSEYQFNGYGYKALSLFVDEYLGKLPIEAFIRKENPFFNAIKNILLKVGFLETEDKQILVYDKLTI